MKQIFTKIALSLAIIATSLFATTITTTQPVHAASNCRYLLGMTSWDCNTVEYNSTDSLTRNVWTIASNVLTDMTVAATYLVLGFVIYGGYLYIFASGDASKVMAGKKTLTRAFIGLAIVLLSNVILNTIRIALVGQNGGFVNCTSQDCVGGTDGSNLAHNLITWFIGTAGIVAAIYVVVGGVGYITSSGDSGKLQKSKNTILYSLIGLAIVALAQIITAFVFNMIEDADTSSFTTTTLIAKEQSYEKIQ